MTNEQIKVSIHAPVMGANTTQYKESDMKKFQSTHP